MSAVPADVYLKREPLDESLDPRRTESKLSLAIDAVTKQKSHSVQAVKSYLEALLGVLNSFNVVQSREGALDARILATIDASKGFVNEYRSLMLSVSESDQADEYGECLTSFLSGILTLKKNYQISETAAYLWRDALGFLARELFLATVAPLLKHRRWSLVKTLLDSRYSVQKSECDYAFTAFDGFQRSLDVFRNRRLNLQRLSVSADVLKQRIDQTQSEFASVIQADFILHIYSVLNGHSPMASWYARTLGYADNQLISGFDLFVSARAGKCDPGLDQLFGVANWAQLRETLLSIVNEANPGTSSSVDYAGLIAANNTIFDQSAAVR